MLVSVLWSFGAGPFAADITPERIRFEAALPLEAAALPPGPYLVSGTLTAGERPLGSFLRIPRLRLPCPKPPCAALVQVEIPFANVTETLLRAFIDGRLAGRAEALFRTPGSDAVRRAVIPLALSPEALDLDGGSAAELARVEAVSLHAPTGELRIRLRFFNPFAFPARLERMEMELRPGTRNAYPLEETPDLELPPGETLHEAAVKPKAEDLLVIASRKLVTDQYDLSVNARISGTLTVRIAGRSVQLAIPE